MSGPELGEVQAKQAFLQSSGASAEGSDEGLEEELARMRHWLPQLAGLRERDASWGSKNTVGTLQPLPADLSPGSGDHGDDGVDFNGGLLDVLPIVRGYWQCARIVR